jgi:hypothetical protein
MLEMNRPTPHTLYRGREVRHLLIEGNDPGAMTLSQVFDGVRTVIDTGTSYEMSKKADAMWQEWITGEGFEYQKDGSFFAFESLEAVVALVLLMRYTVIHDSKCESPRNLTGVVPLVQWKGWTDKNGDSYMYSFSGGPSLYGRPDVAIRHSLKPLKTIAEMADTVKKENALGPSHTFTLG